MNCIDAIEGVLKSILEGFQRRFADGELDDSEYARNVKTLIESAAPFVGENKEIGTSPDLLRKVLYESSRDWWVNYVKSLQEKDAEEDGETIPEGDEGYMEHYFDYLYHRGVYPD
ncbi:MAG: hypothetical protein ACLFOY_17590 [Desulfatibacillaceae bacterium]